MADELRRKAEELLSRNPEETPVLATADVQRIFHELDVHQVELQMQNEELRGAQHELAAARDNYVELYEFAPVGYLTLDPGGRILEANFSAAALLGLERGKLLAGRAFAGFVQRGSLNDWERNHQQVIASQSKHCVELSLQRADGAEVVAHVECSLRSESGCCLMALVDITERVQAEKALKKSREDLAELNRELERRVEDRTAELRESEEKYRMVFESESDAIMIFDGETLRFIDVNNASLELYGYTRDEMLQLTQSAITAEPEESAASIHQTLEGTLSAVPRRIHRKKDGTVFPVEIAACSFPWRGRPVVCGVIRDISQRIAREEELRKLASELSLAEHRERQRVAAELHDGVSQLLSSSYLRLSVLKESPLPEVAVEALGTICDILQETLQQTRTLTFELSCPMLNELGLAAALEELCASMTHEHTMHFEFSGDLQPLPLHRDRQIVLYRSARELLINVMKHAGAKNAFVDLNRQGGQVRICVADDGRGFDAAMAGKGFSLSGGFGLFSIREYLHHAGGSLEIESVPGDGTQVVMMVPLENDHG